MIDLGRNEYVRSSGTSVAIFSYATPWCGCSVQAGSRVTINGKPHFVTASYVGPAESPLELAEEIARRWSELVTIGTLTNGGAWIVALAVHPGQGPAVEHDCYGLRQHVGWSSSAPS